MAGVPLDKIGKSLLKYFKPIRVAKPHYPGRHYPEPRTADASDPSANSLEQEKTDLLRLTKVSNQETNKSSIEEIEDLPVPKQAFSNWLELVIYLLQACKRASKKMKQRVGSFTYRSSVQSENRKVKTCGSIVDAKTTDEID